MCATVCTLHLRPRASSVIGVDAAATNNKNRLLNRAHRCCLLRSEAHTHTKTAHTSVCVFALSRLCVPLSLHECYLNIISPQVDYSVPTQPASCSLSNFRPLSHTCASNLLSLNLANLLIYYSFSSSPMQNCDFELYRRHTPLVTHKTSCY